MTMTSETEQSPICYVCKKTHPWPDGTVPKHPFNGGPDDRSSAWLGNRRADGTTRSGGSGPQRGPERGLMTGPRAAYPIDPVLRQALVDAGVITPKQLRDAEEKIQSITGLFNSGSLVTRAREGGGNG